MYGRRCQNIEVNPNVKFGEKRSENSFSSNTKKHAFYARRELTTGNGDL